MNKQNNEIKILFVEDDYLVATQITNTLSELGFNNIIEASNGKEAIKLTETAKPDLIIMDLEMPEMGGIEAAAIIQEKHPTPVIVLTAYETSELLNDAAKVGISAYMVKPLKKYLIERSITIALARHKDLMEVRRLNEELKKALAEIKTLRGILPICAECHNIRDENNNWIDITSYISNHTEAEFSHSLCPKCAKKLYGNEKWYIKMMAEKKDK